MESDWIRPARSGAMAYFEGLRVPLDGYRYMKAHRHLWRYAWWPVLINACLSVVMLVSVFYAVSFIYSWLVSWFSPGWVGTLIGALLTVGLAVMALGLGIVIILIAGTVLCSVFYSRLTKRMETDLGESASQLSDLPLVTELKDGLCVLVELGFGNLALLALNFVPILGSALSTGGALLFNSWLLGLEFLDYPLALRGWDRGRRKEYLCNFRFHVFGVGSVVLALNVIPVVGSFVLTTAVVGSVLLYRRMRIVRERV